MEGHWKFQGSWKSLENLNFKRRVQYYQLNFWMVLVTSTSMIGCGAIFEPPPFLCHCCNWDVQAKGACESSSSNRSFVEAQLNKKTYITWTWGPTHGCRIPPCRLCMNSKHSLLRQVRCIGQSLEYVVGHSSESYGSTCFWNKNYFWSLVHWISSRYSSSKNRLAFNKLVGTMWWSLSAIDFPEFKIWRFISTLVNIDIFSSEVPQPSSGNCTKIPSSPLTSVKVLNRSFLRL